MHIHTHTYTHIHSMGFEELKQTMDYNPDLDSNGGRDSDFQSTNWSTMDLRNQNYTRTAHDSSAYARKCTAGIYYNA